MRLWVSRALLASSSAVKTASSEELRTLLALIAHEGCELSPESISKETGISRSRVAAAIALFSEEGIIRDTDPCEKNPTITEEFEQRLRRGELCEESALDTAKTIRDEGLASLIDEIARLMKTDSLSTSEIKIITSLTTQYSFSPEYLLLLGAHLSGTHTRFTPMLLRDKAMDLLKVEITTVEELERYIQALAEENDIHREFRRILGIYGRALSPAEKKLFNRWGVEFGFGTAIVTEAYNRATIKAQGSISYMDTIITSWHEAGCKTVAECIAHSESTKTASPEKAEKKMGRKGRPEPVRYGDFDINEAFERALERSYGTDAKTDGKGES